MSIANTTSVDSVSHALVCELSPDGSTLAVAFVDKSVRLFIRQEDSWTRQMTLFHNDGAVEHMRWLSWVAKDANPTLAISSGQEIAIFEPYNRVSPVTKISAPFMVSGFSQSGDFLMAWGSSNTILFQKWKNCDLDNPAQILVPMPASVGWPLAAPFRQYRDFLTVGKRNSSIHAWSIVDHLHESKVCMPVSLYESRLTDSAYGPGLLVEKVGFSHWVVVQKNGWTLIKWETEDDEPGIHQEISADLEGVKQVIVTDPTAKSPSFGFVTKKNTVFWVSNGHSQLVDAPEGSPKLDCCFYDFETSKIIGLFTEEGETLIDCVNVSQWPLTWCGEKTAIQVTKEKEEEIDHPLEDVLNVKLDKCCATSTHIDSVASLIGLSNGSILHSESGRTIRGFTGPIIHLFELAREFRVASLVAAGSLAAAAVSVGVPQAAAPPRNYIAISGSSEVGIIDFQGQLKYMVPGHHAAITKLVTYVNLPNVLGVKYLDGGKRLWSLETNAEYTDKLSAENWEIELHCLCTSGEDGQIFVDTRDSGLDSCGSWAVNLEPLLKNGSYVQVCRSILAAIGPNIEVPDEEDNPFYTLLAGLPPSHTLSGSLSTCGAWIYDSGLLSVSHDLSAVFLPIIAALADAVYEAQEGKRLQLTTLKPLTSVKGFLTPSATALGYTAVHSSSRLKRAAKQCLQAYFSDMRFDHESLLTTIYNSHSNLLFDPTEPTTSCISLYIITAIARVTGVPEYTNHVCQVIRNGLETDSVLIQQSCLDSLHQLWPSLKPGLDHIVDIEAVITCLAINSHLSSDCWAVINRVTRSNAPLLITALVFLLENLEKPLVVRITAIDVLSDFFSHSKKSSSMDMVVPFVMHTACKMLNPDLLRHSTLQRGVSLQSKVTALLSQITHTFPYIVTFHKPSQRLAVAIYPTATAVMIEKNVSRRRSSLSELNRDLDIKVTDTCSLIVYDLRIGSEYAYLDPQEFNSNHAAPVWGLVFSPDGKMVAGLTGIGSNSVPGPDFDGETRVVIWQMESHGGTFSSLFGNSSHSSHSSQGVYSESVKFGKTRNVVERQVEILLYASVGKIGYRDKQTPSFEPAKVESLGKVKSQGLRVTWVSETMLVVQGEGVRKKVQVN
ncbi:hypothetical protein CJU90_5137 [Yarrowia sp. C11]|nr:hypothetical protein CJU90_5137 [Yarrowia sp. C11]KAG5364937.1 hypothetical protein CKK34_3765 [Yarrowia sp. E02]